MTPFVEASRQLVRGLEYHGGGLPTFRHVGRDLAWRHHGLGMLQSELSDTLRIHIWHPKLVDPGMAWPRCVHDHRFDITSAVMVGEIVDWPHGVMPAGSLEPGHAMTLLNRDYVRAKCYMIEHAKEQDRLVKGGCSTATSAKVEGDVWVNARPQKVWPTGHEYRIQRRDFHTTLVNELTISVVHRSNFDDRLARVLCAPDGDVTAVSGIVRDDSVEHTVLVNWILREAAYAIERMP